MNVGRIGRGARLAAVMLLLLGSVAACGVGSEAAVGAGAIELCDDVVVAALDLDLSDDPEVAAAQVSRGRLGYRADREFVESNDLRGIGLVLTEEEQAGLEVEAFSSSPPVDDVITEVVELYAAEHPDTFGWVGISRVSGSPTIEVGFSDDVEVHRAALEAEVGDRAPIIVVEASAALIDLEPLHRRVVAQMRRDGALVGVGSPQPVAPGGPMRISVDAPDTEAGARALAEILELGEEHLVCLEERDMPRALL